MSCRLGVLSCTAAALAAMPVFGIDWGADKVANLMTADATEILSGEQALKGVVIGADGVSLVAEADASLTLGSGGLTNNGSNVTWAWPTILGVSQIWYTAKDKSLAIREKLTGSAITFHGRGRVDVYSTNEVSKAQVGSSNSGENGVVSVWLQPGAQLCADDGTLTMSCYSGGGLHLMGNTLEHNIVCGTQNSGTPSGFFVAAGTTNVIKGSFTTQYANQSTVGIAGHLTIKGGLKATTTSNAQGGWYPFGNGDIYTNGYLKIVDAPVLADRVVLQRGTLELAVTGNKFTTRGLYVTGGTLNTSVADAFKSADSNKLKLTGGTWDLMGQGQGVELFCGNGGTVTSATAAQLHVGNSAYFFDSKFNKDGKPASSPALNMGTNVTVCSTVFTGAAGLADDGSLDLYVAAANSSTGTLSVSQGRLVLSEAAGAEHYPGTSFAKTQGSWAGRVEVTGGTLVIEHSAALGPKSELYVSGGSVELAEGVALPVFAVYVTDGQGGWTPCRGVCGGADSGAARQPTFPGTLTPVFTGKGSVLVGATLPDGWPAAKEASWVEAGADKLVTTSANWDPSTASVYDGSLVARFASGTEAKLPDNDFAFIQGLTVAQPNFVFTAGEGTSLVLGSAGVTNATTGVVWEWPTSIGTFSPLWWLSKGSTMELRAPLTGMGTLKFWGGGRIDIYSTNTIEGTVYVGNSNDQKANPVGEGSAYLHPGAQLAAAGATLCLYCRGGSGLHLMGNTLDCNVVAGTQNSTTAAALFVPEGTTNVINGSFATRFANQSYMGVAGHLTLRGGANFQGNESAVQQRFHPISKATGTLRIEEKPVTSCLCDISVGRLELAVAGNLFKRQGLWINGGTVMVDADGAFVAQGQTSGDSNNNVTIGSGTFDLNGHDVQFDAVCARGGTVTSATPAQFRLKDDRLHSYTGQISSYVKPFLSTGTVCRTVFMGGAGLSKEGALDFYMANENASTGTLAVASGRLVMSAESDSETYPGTAIKKSCGTWSAGRVEVKGGTLVVEHKNAFGMQVTMSVTDGMVDLANGIRARVEALYVNGQKQDNGVYGGPSSSAPNKLDVFSGTGQLVVGKVGLVIIVE